jgi:hypothetical protein
MILVLLQQCVDQTGIATPLEALPVIIAPRQMGIAEIFRLMYTLCGIKHTHFITREIVNAECFTN